MREDGVSSSVVRYGGYFELAHFASVQPSSGVRSSRNFAINELPRAAISSEDLTGEGFTSKFTYIAVVRNQFLVGYWTEDPSFSLAVGW